MAAKIETPMTARPGRIHPARREGIERMEHTSELKLPETFEPGDGLAAEVLAAWPLFELLGGIDPFTFRAPNMRTAAAAVMQLDNSFECRATIGDGRRGPPFCWHEYMDYPGIDRAFLEANAATLALVFDSFVCAPMSTRGFLERAWATTDAKRRDQYRRASDVIHQKSARQIGFEAAELARACANYVEGKPGARSPWETAQPVNSE